MLPAVEGQITGTLTSFVSWNLRTFDNTIKHRRYMLSATFSVHNNFTEFQLWSRFDLVVTMNFGSRILRSSKSATFLGSVHTST